MASVKCPACGLVNFADAQACRRCKGPLGEAVASTQPADSKPGGGRTVLGPVSTQAGFKGWHVVCLPDALITVPQGFLGSVAATASTALPILGLAGVLLTKAGKSSGDVKASLAEATEGQLRADPQNVVYPLAELASISFKRPLLSNPEIRLERRGQGATVFVVTVIAAYGEISTELKRLYPGLCRNAA
jgi:hypothetical protein